MTARFELSAGGVVVRHSESGVPEVVLIRVRFPDGSERWTLPKGLVEKGESLEEAARREVREEAGVEAEIARRLEPVEYWYWWKAQGEKARVHKKVYYFLMTPRRDDMAAHDFEVEEVRWFPLSEAYQVASYRAVSGNCYASSQRPAMTQSHPRETVARQRRPIRATVEKRTHEHEVVNMFLGTPPGTKMHLWQRSGCREPDESIFEVTNPSPPRHREGAIVPPQTGGPQGGWTLHPSSVQKSCSLRVFPLPAPAAGA